MNTKLNVVRFENEDVIATSGVCEKTVYELHYDRELHNGYNADYVSGKNAASLGLSTYNCFQPHGDDVAHLNGVANGLVESTYVTADGHFTGTDGIKFHWTGTTFEVCSTPQDHNNHNN